MELIKSINSIQKDINLKLDQISNEYSNIKKNIQEKSIDKLNHKIKVLNDKEINIFLDSFIESGNFAKEIYKLSSRYCDTKKECEYTFKKERLTVVMNKRPSLYLNGRFFSRKEIIENIRGMIVRTDGIESESSIINYLFSFDADFNNRSRTFVISEKNTENLFV